MVKTTYQALGISVPYFVGETWLEDTPSKVFSLWYFGGWQARSYWGDKRAILLPSGRLQVVGEPPTTRPQTFSMW